MKYGDSIVRIFACRVCGERALHKFLSLGSMPLANCFLREEQLGIDETRYPLAVCFCSACGMVQLEHVVAPEIMFKEYPYLTGASEPAKLHFTQLAEEVSKKFNLSPESLVIDIGSNDGTLLQAFQRLNMRSLGVELASNVAELANSRGVETVTTFFTNKLARELFAEGGPAKVITATNVFAHMHDLSDVLRGVNYLLADDGIFVIEVPYLVDMIEKLEFDTIYHEHLSYFAVRPLVTLFARSKMNIIEVNRISHAGGSIRIYVEKSAQRSSPSVTALLQLEAEKGLNSIETYYRFAQEVGHTRETLLSLLHSLKAKGASIAGYGAAAKGNVLLNYCGIGTEILDYIIDTTPFKQGRYSPGMHIPVFPESHFYKSSPNYALLLAWNYTDAILAKEKRYRQAGGKFIVPIPKPQIM